MKVGIKRRGIPFTGIMYVWLISAMFIMIIKIVVNSDILPGKVAEGHSPIKVVLSRPI